MTLGLVILVMEALTEDIYGSVAARDAAFSDATPVGLLASGAWALVTMGLIARSVGYRSRDGLFMLTPLYSYVLAVDVVALDRVLRPGPGI